MEPYPYLTRKPHRSKGGATNLPLANYDCPAGTLFFHYRSADDHPSAVEAVRVGKVADHRYLCNTLYSRENLDTPFHSLYS